LALLRDVLSLPFLSGAFRRGCTLGLSRILSCSGPSATTQSSSKSTAVLTNATAFVICSRQAGYWEVSTRQKRRQSGNITKQKHWCYYSI